LVHIHILKKVKKIRKPAVKFLEEQLGENYL